MRVVHVIKATGLAGAERHLLELLPGLRGRGVDARLVLLIEPGRPMDPIAAAAAAAGVPLDRLTIAADLDPTLRWRLERCLRRSAPDLVHTHLIHADTYAAPAARAVGVRAVVTTRHNPDRFRRRWPVRALLRRQLHHLDRIIAVSDAVARFTREVEGAPADLLCVIPHGLMVPDHRDERGAVRAELGCEPETFVVGMVGRMTAQKGFEDGLDACGRLLPSGDLRVVLLGDGALRPRLERRVRSDGDSRAASTAHAAQAARAANATDTLRDRTRFLGWRADAVRLMAGFDVLLVPSRWEGFGLVLLEAMAQGVPVVAYATDAISEVVIHQQTGLLVPPAEIAALAAALERLRADVALRRALGAAGRARAAGHFAADRMVTATLAVYAELLGDA